VIFFARGGGAFLLGVLGKCGCRTWFFDGGIVVGFGAIVVFWWLLFWCWKCAMVLRFIFGG
jgi:hypothetical protein